MADLNSPLMPVMNGGPTMPIEGIDESAAKGGSPNLAAFNIAHRDTIGQISLDRFLGDQLGNQTRIPHDDAVAIMKHENLDPSFVPQTGLTQGALSAEFNRQYQQQDDQMTVKQAHLGSTSQFVDSLLGGATDPINLAMPAAGKLTSFVKAGVAARFAVGASEGAAYAAGNDLAHAKLTGHDDDASSWQTIRDITLGVGVGGLLHSTFGPRPLVGQGGTVTTDTIRTLERSDAAAKVQHVDVDHVISPTGAIGAHQVEPATAAEFGFSKEDLYDPIKNKAAAQDVLDSLSRKYGNDPEAIAIGYNAGPGRADKWLRAGRDDSILPHETQDYLARLRGAPLEARKNAFNLAQTQLSNDSPVNVAPVADFKTNALKIQDEHDLEMSQLHTQAMMDAVPKRGSMFTSDPDVMTQLDAVNNTKVPAIAAPDAEMPLAKENEQYAANTLADAKQKATSLGEDHVASLDSALADNAKDVGYDDEITKAVHAAVQCGVMKGLS